MNFLDNGTVLPSGLLGENFTSKMAGFAKTYQNFALRLGIVVATYPTPHEKNVSKLSNEYDVIVFEQMEDQGSTPITYRNCLSMEGLGSLADFFEMSLRKQTLKPKDAIINTKDQDGAVVLVLCLDGVSEKGIIVGAVTHPDRKSTLVDEGPRLEGEYNGVNIKVEKDGSTTLTFKGATDNSGKIIDENQGPTTIAIEKDGSYQVKHKTITQRLDKNGKASLTSEDDISNTTKKSFNIDATENVAIKAAKNMNVSCADFVTSASGSATLECQKMTVNAQSEINLKGSQFQVQAESLAKIKASTITLDGLVSLGGQGGQPVLLLSTQMIGVGNLGMIVLSQAISGFATKVTAI